MHTLPCASLCEYRRFRYVVSFRGRQQTVALGGTVNVVGGGTTDTYSDSNVYTKETKDSNGNSTIDVQFSTTPKFTSVTTNDTNGKAVLDGSTLTSTDSGSDKTIVSPTAISTTDGTNTTAITSTGITTGGVTINGGTTDTITGLSNTNWNNGSPTGYSADRAATEGELTGLSAEGLKFAGNNNEGTGGETATLGSTVNVIGSAAASGTNYSASNLTTTENNGTITIEMSTTPTFDSVTAGSGDSTKVVISDNGVQVGGKTYINSTGINANGNTITNVADGVNQTDAVNVSQLTTAEDKAKTTVSQGKNITVNATNEADGHTDYNVALDDTVTLGTAGSADAITLDGTKGTIVAGKGTDAVNIDGTAGTIKTGTIDITGGTTNTITGLSNTSWNNGSPTGYSADRAATEGELSQAAASATTKLADGKNTNVTSTTNKDGSTTYEVNLNDNSTLGSGAYAVNINGNAGTITAGTGANTVTIDGTKAAVTAGTGANAITMDGTEAAVTAGTGADAVVLNGKNAGIAAGTGTNAVNINGTNGTITAGTQIAIDGVNGKETVGKVTITGNNGDTTGGTANTITDLSNTNWNNGSPTGYSADRAATEGELTGLSAEGLKFAGNNNEGTGDTVALGSTVNVIGSAAASGTTYSASNLTTTESNGTITIEMSTTPTFDSVTAGTGASQVVIGSSGVAVGGKTYIDSNGLNANSQKISNVEAGTADTDAVNVSQLTTTVDKAKTTVSQGKNITVNATNEADGHTDYNVALDDTVTLGTAGSADAITLDGTKGTIVAGIGTDAVNIDGTVGTIKTGTVNITGGSTDTITGLSNTTWTGSTNDVSRAATEGELGSVVTSGITVAGDSGSSTTQLGKKITINGDSNITTADAGDGDNGSTVTVKLNNKVILGSETDAVVLDGNAGTITAGAGTDAVNIDGTAGTIKTGTIDITGGSTDTITGLSNTTWNNGSPIGYSADRAATEGELTGLSAEGLKFAGNNNEGSGDTVALGSTVNVIGSAAASGTTYSASNLTTTENNGTITIEMSTTPTFDSVTAGSGDSTKVVISDNGVQVGGKTYINSTGIDANSQKISNVEAGTADTDAVNVSQLTTTVDKAKTTVSQGKNITVKSTNEADGHTDYNVALDDTVTLGTAGSADAITLDGTKGTITAGTGTNAVNIDGTVGTIKTGTIDIAGGSTDTITGLSNTTWNASTAVADRAATEGELGSVVTSGITVAGDSGSSATQLGKKVTINGDSNITTADASDGDNGSTVTVKLNNKVTLGSGTDTVVLDGTAGTITAGDTTTTNAVSINGTAGTITTGTVDITGGSTDTITGLSNTNWNNGSPTGYSADRAATEGELSQAAASATTKLADGKNTNVTSTTNNDGSTTYEVNLNDNSTLGSGADAVNINGDTGTITAGIGADAVNINGTTGTITAGDTTSGNAVVINGTDGTITASTKISLDGVNGEATIGDVLINGSTGTITGLTNITWDSKHYVSGRAATEDELYQATSNVTSSGLNFGADDESLTSGKVIHKDLGDTLDIVGGYSGSGTTSATNVKTVTTADGKIQVQLADNAKFTSVTTTDGNGNTTVTSGTGTTTTDSSGNTTATTSTGTTTTDNKGNSTSVSSTGLTTKDNSGNSTSVSSTGLTTKDSSGNKTTVSGNGVSIAGANGKNVSLTSNGLDNGGNKITNVADGEVSSTSTDAVNGSQLYSVEQSVTAAKTTVSSGKNITVTSTQEADGHTDYNVALDDTVTLGSGSNAVKMDGTTGTITAGTGDNAVSINGTNGTISAGTKVSLDGANGTATIGNVTINGSGSTGTVNGLTNKTWNPDSITSGQAATEDQLKIVDKETIHYDTNSDGSVNYNKVTMGGGTSGTTITNVAAGEVSSTSTDAVNGSQLYSVEQTVSSQGDAINSLGNDISNLGNKIDKVGAGAAALAGLHPLDFDPEDKWDFAVGYGHYDGAGAAAIGAFYRPDEDTMLSFGYEMGNGENMWNLGLSFKLGSGNHITASRTAMAREITDLREKEKNRDAEMDKLNAKNDKLEKDNEEMKQEIELLKEKVGI